MTATGIALAHLAAALALLAGLLLWDRFGMLIALDALSAFCL